MNIITVITEHHKLIELIAFIALYVLKTKSDVVSKIKEVIAVVSEILQSVITMSNDDAMNKAIVLLREKVAFLKLVPDNILKWAIQSTFNSIKVQANKEVKK